MANENTIVGHFCGGAGTRISDEVFGKIDSLGDGFAKIRYHYVDTSRANIDKITPKGEFTQVKTKSNSIAEIQGSGGERRAFAKDIMENVKEYLDKNKYLSLVRNEFHVVVFSASGGSGSVIGPLIVRDLITRNIPTIAIVVGDSSNAVSCLNTADTLSTLDHIARTTKKCLSVIYTNNQSLLEEKKAKISGMTSAEKEANRFITNIMTSLSVFLSGQNEDLDNQDMMNMIDQSNYTKITIQPGLYGLLFYSKTIAEFVKDSIPIGGRSLALRGKDADTGLTLLHNKRGFVDNENVINIIKEENFPLHVISFANFLVVEEAKLREKADNFNNIMNSIKTKEVEVLEDSKLDDETGLIL